MTAPDALYRVPTDEELAAADVNTDMNGDVLLRPNGSVLCVLGEPEDRSFWRDASEVVDELNALLAVVEAARVFAATTDYGAGMVALRDLEAALSALDEARL